MTDSAPASRPAPGARARFAALGDVEPLSGGEGVAPPWVPHGGVAGPDGCTIVDLFSPPRPHDRSRRVGRWPVVVVGAGGFDEIVAIDGQYISTEVAGGSTGRVVGIATGEAAAHVVRADYRVPLRRGHYPGV